MSLFEALKISLKFDYGQFISILQQQWINGLEFIHSISASSEVFKIYSFILKMMNSSGRWTSGCIGHQRRNGRQRRVGHGTRQWTCGGGASLTPSSVPLLPSIQRPPTAMEPMNEMNHLVVGQVVFVGSSVGLMALFWPCMGYSTSAADSWCVAAAIATNVTRCAANSRTLIAATSTSLSSSQTLQSCSIAMINAYVTYRSMHRAKVRWLHLNPTSDLFISWLVTFDFSPSIDYSFRLSTV